MRQEKLYDNSIKCKIDTHKNEKTFPRYRFFKKLVPIVVITFAIMLGICGYMEVRVKTPFSKDKLVDISRLNKNHYYWGSYRPGVYFGMKTKEPFSPVTGLMWYFQSTLQTGGKGLRHWCTQDDKLEKYGWTKHDGKNFGIQEIVDNKVLLKTSFIKYNHGHNGGDWTAKINVSHIEPNLRNKKISLLYYIAIENKTDGNIKPLIDYLSNSLVGIEGQTKELGYFDLSFNVVSENVVDQSYLVTTTPDLSYITKSVLINFQVAIDKEKRKKKIVLPSETLKTNNKQISTPNLIVLQVTGELPLELEVIFEHHNLENQNKKLTGENYNKNLNKYEKLFDVKFEEIFNLNSKGYTQDEINFAKLAFSNMIGSIGYFYGSSQVQSILNGAPISYWKAPLYSAVPSRSFFPRGFLWDEGFHGLLLSNWNLDIEMDIISHWFDLMNINGWIPREMILGEEALAKVPQEFVTQDESNANPPTFFITLQYILDHKRDELLSNHMDLLKKLYPRLNQWFQWFNLTQIGEIPGTYRWRGRKYETNIELNPKTLTSGLDDYPRASHPSIDERHIDLRCWIALASKTMAIISEILHKPSHEYKSTFKYLSNNNLLNKLHWSPKTNTYADYGLHTDKVKLQKLSQTSKQIKSTEKVRVVLEEPKNQFVDSSFGYISLFPFLLRLIDPSSYQLKKILEDLQKPELLWTKYGLRSLAKISPMYMKFNTEHDPPYWRGPIWINLNYMTVAALHHYAKVDGLYKAEAEKIYFKLRDNIIKNVIHQYKKTGYIWENYEDNLGEGKGSHPFTGWTSLTVLLMAELY
ncbi:PREDICTED: mannosyl-oligosaccharide glucosidase GCS1 [Ceratosolen solmsi marchali]|uniref:Mannosyl-oligosaccharide glucosidase n=1 Tax=Ceratosolen solmsi marchali TaxID=326594 RepID=A0AAJ7DZK1_9HYME|nr:PREDICTED: mannosyl-oligosaccharide glucosidase GCS1 [Ceratosolen solmsi marchali]